MFKLLILAILLILFADNFTYFIKTILPIILILFVGFNIVKILRENSLNQSYLKSSLAQIDSMDGHEFEKYLEIQFRSLGYHVENIGAKGHDFGVDLILKRDGIKTVVQAKRYNGKVGIKAIQEIVSGQKYYDAQKALVVTNSYFTDSAKDLAKKCNVILWDRDDCKYKFIK